VLKPLRPLLVLLGCLHLAGGPQAVLQLVAWGGMLIDYGAEFGLVEGARRTFDGAHPCDLCRAIEADRESEREDPALPAPARDALDLKHLAAPPLGELAGPGVRDQPPAPAPGVELRQGRDGSAPDPPPPRAA